MTEDEVNIRCREWLQNHSFKYKGILNVGLGQVPVPDGTRSILIDHQGFRYKGNKTNDTIPQPKIIKITGNQERLQNDNHPLLYHREDDDVSLVWIEAKGSNLNLSELLEGFIRVTYAVFEGGGKGYLATPHREFNLLLERKEFLETVAESVNGKGTMGLLDAEKGVLIEF